jgi:hypothetical protein
MFVLFRDPDDEELAFHLFHWYPSQPTERPKAQAGERTGFIWESFHHRTQPDVRSRGHRFQPIAEKAGGRRIDADDSGRLAAIRGGGEGGRRSAGR